ncbi:MULTISPECIES: Fic family protein [Glutamicibacter]|uniref:Fic family protein n=1 Tax=Glutamicibacter arilaitensis (strain DSM 16368 / CIP 108037 / IAM 15318 / JCM 13566 / NCIMB 14258 / Re117) TaxID=861360 RepID=A0ABP1U675_GLUAR|nr:MULTISPECIES: Fic family protein [Glutamicibacter]CBT77524.1 Fic family protein [Glutamicibacter arilaitensis Re117]
MSNQGASRWPAHRVETLPWSQKVRGGTREDRIFSSVETTIPPLIARLDYAPSLPETLASEQALLTVAQADTDAEGHSAALSRFMVRSESVASSKIERISASARDYAKAMAGHRANISATSMVAASTALHELITAVGLRGEFLIDQFTSAHRALMVDDQEESDYAGRFRDMQNWIGGSDYSPRGALHVPPAPERVNELMNDLITYLNRDDVPVLVQAAIGHAQFESIHAFTDGNGRIGRALVSAVLRRRGVTRNAVVPLASGLLARREDYFAALGSYRQGQPSPLILLFAQSARAAALASRETIARLKSMPVQWSAELRPRTGSVASRLIGAFLDHPVMSTQEVDRAAGAGATSQTYRVIDQLEKAGFIEEITGRKKARVWAAAEVMAELDDLDRRIQQDMRAEL